MTIVLNERYTTLGGSHAVSARIPGEDELWALDLHPSHVPKPKQPVTNDTTYHGWYEVVNCPDNFYPKGNVFGFIRSLERSITAGYIPEGTIFKRWAKNSEDPEIVVVKSFGNKCGLINEQGEAVGMLASPYGKAPKCTPQ